MWMRCRCRPSPTIDELRAVGEKLTYGTGGAAFNLSYGQTFHGEFTPRRTAHALFDFESPALRMACQAARRNPRGGAWRPAKSDGRSAPPMLALKSDDAHDEGWKEPGVRFPVTCPICARALLTELPVALIAEALIVGSAIRLHAACHDVYWDATELEVEQIREYLGAGVIT